MPGQSTLGPTMRAVWSGTIHTSTRYRKFPYNAVDQAAIKAQFAGCIFPKVFVDVDCTHISIKAPPHDENVCVTRQPQLINTVAISCLSLKRYEKFTVGETFFFFFIDCGMKEIPTSEACLYRWAFTYGGRAK